MFKKSILIVLSLLMVLSIAGCKTGKEPVAPTEQPTVQKDSIIIGIPAEGSSMDPHTACNRAAIENMILGLTDLDENAQVIPGIASSWEVSEDELEYVFTIDTSIKFANGDNVTVEDILFSFDRAVKDEGNAARYESIKSWEKVDDTHVKMTLNYPCALFLANLANSSCCILNKKVVESAGDEFGINSKGAFAGPYDLESWTKGVSIKLTANPYYKKDLSIKNIEYRFISESSTGVISVETGDIDVYMNPSFVDVQNVKSDKIKVASVEKNGFEFLGFCLTKSPYDDVRVRQAIAYSYDPDELVEAAIGSGGATVAHSILPSFVFGSEITENTPVYKHDPEKAKALLAEAGYPDGLNIKIITMNSAYLKAAEYLQEAMKSSGFTVEIELTEYSKFVQDLIAGNLDAFIIGVTEDYPDADLTLYAQFTTDGGQNVHMYSNEEVDDMLLKARQSSNPDERKELYAKVQEILMTDLPALPLYFSKTFALYNSNIENFTLSYSGFTMLENMSWAAGTK